MTFSCDRLEAQKWETFWFVDRLHSQDAATCFVTSGRHLDLFGVPAPISLEHALLFANFQEDHDIIGDLGEIGVFKGQFLTLLMLKSRPNEHVLAIDVFDDLTQNFDTSGGATTIAEVRRNVGRFVDSNTLERLRMVTGDSLYLQSEELRTHMLHRGMRFFGIDGGHSWYHTVNDLLLADRLVTSGGIVVLDDISNAGWPGVMEGFARYMLLTADRRLWPFMIGHNKVWLTTWDFREKYREIAWNDVRITECEAKRRSEFFGTTVVGF